MLAAWSLHEYLNVLGVGQLAVYAWMPLVVSFYIRRLPRYLAHYCSLQLHRPGNNIHGEVNPCKPALIVLKATLPSSPSLTGYPYPRQFLAAIRKAHPPGALSGHLSPPKVPQAQRRGLRSRVGYHPGAFPGYHLGFFPGHRPLMGTRLRRISEHTGVRSLIIPGSFRDIIPGSFRDIIPGSFRDIIPSWRPDFGAMVNQYLQPPALYHCETSVLCRLKQSSS
jgi:hypothetical protein